MAGHRIAASGSRLGCLLACLLACLPACLLAARGPRCCRVVVSVCSAACPALPGLPWADLTLAASCWGAGDPGRRSNSLATPVVVA